MKQIRNIYIFIQISYYNVLIKYGISQCRYKSCSVNKPQGMSRFNRSKYFHAQKSKRTWSAYYLANVNNLWEDHHLIVWLMRTGKRMTLIAIFWPFFRFLLWEIRESMTFFWLILILHMKLIFQLCRTMNIHYYCQERSSDTVPIATVWMNVGIYHLFIQF